MMDCNSAAILSQVVPKLRHHETRFPPRLFPDIDAPDRATRATVASRVRRAEDPSIQPAEPALIIIEIECLSRRTSAVWTAFGREPLQVSAPPGNGPHRCDLPARAIN